MKDSYQGIPETNVWNGCGGVTGFGARAKTYPNVVNENSSLPKV